MDRIGLDWIGDELNRIGYWIVSIPRSEVK